MKIALDDDDDGDVHDNDDYGPFWPLGSVLGTLPGYLGPSWGERGASCRLVGGYLESSEDGGDNDGEDEE
eukprot:1632257-Pyramimonas_sp.AAC.1